MTNPEILKPYQARSREALREFLPSKSEYAMYDMMRYFVGFADERLQPAEAYGGKHFRAALCLLTADLYGDIESAIPVATSIELFHNVTLIHDDIVDSDTRRRGRPTIWKQWGIPHAINTGDAQLLLAYKALGNAIAKEPVLGLQAQQCSTDTYLAVAEGQYADFTIADLPLTDKAVTTDAYFTMIQKKTAVLVGAAVKVGGIMAGASTSECEQLYAYGLALGTAVQLNDDYMSIWGDSAHTGKDAYGDIVGRKKTLPILFARDTLTGADRELLCDFYSSASQRSTEVDTVVSLLNKCGAQKMMRDRIEEHLAIARDATDRLSCAAEGKQTLQKLLPECLSH